MNKQIKPMLGDIKEAAEALFELTRELTLLHVISDMALEVMLALDNLSEKITELTDTAALESVAGSEAINLLDEIVDTDAVSELEEQLFSTMESLDDSVLGEFLSELIEKIERRYARLVHAIHELNALLGG